MGYITRYKLSIHGGNDLRKNRDSEYVKFVRLITEKKRKPHDDVGAFDPDDISIPLSWFYDFWINDTEGCKWREHENDMKLFSKKFPSLVFKLEGVGEETGDLWIKYFKNGKMQICRAKIVYDDYDANKLE